MIPHIHGLHHVTAFAGPAPENDAFFTDTLGLRRVKTTVNFDNPYVYHLYFGDKQGTPGTVMTHFPDRKWKQGHRGTGEVAVTAFTVPRGSLGDWEKRLDGSTRIEAFGGEAQTLPRDASQLTELVGRVTLKDLVRETTDVIERLCIETALRLTGDNRASAAEMLGLSRQSLYSKLRRYGLSDGDASDD
jgi:catechol 2,3-dioxygenase-like lactoylglutathione lyase family enzyme